MNQLDALRLLIAVFAIGAGLFNLAVSRGVKDEEPAMGTTHVLLGIILLAVGAINLLMVLA
jgi:hypothetical protein